MIAVLIVGILSTIAIPLLTTYQLRTKTAEAKTNLSAIRVLEEGFFSEYELYRSAAPEPAAIPGSQTVAFDDVTSDFAPLGYAPEGRVYFSYGVAVSADGSAFTADAGADIDADGFVQYWGYTKPGAGGAREPGRVGCNAALLVAESVGPCGTSFGSSVF